TLLGMLLSAHPGVLVASDPYFPLLRSLRNALVRHSGDADLLRTFDPASALQDFYFDDARLAQLDAILAGRLDTPFARGSWTQFLEAVRGRGGIMCPDLAPHYDRLRGGTYRDVFDNALSLVAELRGGAGRVWVGIKEVWMVDFYPVLARAYPDARFVVLLRDPRAVVASMLALREQDESQGAHVLS